MPDRFPTEPRLQSDEIDAALGVARRLDIVRVHGKNLTTGPLYKPLTSMEMYEILQEAFGRYDSRLNEELRQEADLLSTSIEVRQRELKKIRIARAYELDVETLVERTRRLLKLLADTRVVRIAEEYHSLEALVSRVWEADEDDDE